MQTSDTVAIYDSLTMSLRERERRYAALQDEREILIRSLAAIDAELERLPIAIDRYREAIKKLALDHRIAILIRKIDDLETQKIQSAKKYARLIAKLTRK